MARRPQFHLSLATLLTRSFAIYVRNFIPFVLLSALMLSPWVAVLWYVPPEPDALGLMLVATLLLVVLNFLLTGALTYGVVQQLRGQPASMGQAVANGLQSFGRVLGTGIICSLRIVLFSLLLWIPGIWESCRLYVSLPAAVMEGTAGTNAIERSIRLTDGSMWPIFGSWLVMYLIPFGLDYLLDYITDTVVVEPMTYWWWSIAIQVVVAPLAAVAMAVAYFLLREGKENKSVAELAAVFD